MHRQPPSIAAVLVIAIFANTGQAQTGPAKQSFVPVDQLETIFQRSPNGVLLPREEFQRLLEKAQKAEAKKSDAPLSLVKRSAKYEVQQQDKHAVILLSLEMEQFADEWVLVNIPIGNLQIESAIVDGEPAAVAIQKTRPGILYFAHRDAGRFTLQLTMSTPLGIVGSDRVTAFRTVPAVAATLKVACPKDRHLQFNKLKLNRPDPIEMPTEYDIPGGSFDQVQLTWTSRQQQDDSQALVFARTDAQIQLSQDDIRWASNTRVSVFGTAINQLTARVPARLEVTAIDSAGLESWKLEDDPEVADAIRVILNYRQPFTEDRLVQMSAVSAADGEGAASRLPTLEFIDVTSHSGRLRVQHEDQLRLLADVGGGVRQVESKRVSGKETSDEIFDFWMQDFSLSIAVKPRDRELFAEVNSTLAISDTLARFNCKMTIETLNAPLFELPLRLPPGWQLATVTGENKRPVKWRNGSEPNQLVVDPAVPTEAGGLFAVTVQLTKSIADPSEAQTVDLPVITAQNSLLAGGTYEVSGSPDLTVSPVEINGLSPIGSDDEKVLYETQGTGYSGQLVIHRKPVRLSSRSVIRSWMDTRQKTVEAVVTVDVLNGTTRSLQLELPEDLGEEIRFSVVSITQVPGFENQPAPAHVSIVEQNSEPPADGTRKFHLTFDKRFVGAMTLKTRIQQPRTEDTILSAPSIGLTNAIRQHGLIVFEAWPEQLLTSSTDVAESGLQVADAGLVEPPPQNSGRRIALVYRYVKSNYSLNLTEKRFNTEAVPSAVCQKIENVSILSDTGTLQRSCSSVFRCVGVQTLRFTLPDAEQSYLWSTVLDGDAVEVRRDGDDYLVAIPAVSNQSEHTLDILFETTVVEKSMLGKTDQQSIQLAIDSEQEQASPIDVLEQTWDLRYPSSAMLLNYEGGFFPQGTLEQPGWLQNAAAQMSFPTAKNVVRRGVPVALLLLLLFITTTLIVRRRWKSLACLCVLGLLAIPLTLGTNKTSLRDTSMRTSTSKVRNKVGSVAVTSERSNQPADGILPEGLVAGRGFEFPHNVAPDDPFSQSETSAFDAMATQGAMGGGSEYGGQGAFAGGGFGGGMGDGSFASGGLMDEQMTQASREPAESPSRSESLNRHRSPTKSTGSARLSVRTQIASPGDYRSMVFRSVGGTPSAGQLQVTVQPRPRLDAIRISVAAFVILICLMMNNAGIIRKTVFAVFLSLLAVAAVPLVPNEWQPAVDGVFCGIAVGVLIWIGFGCCRNLSSLCQSLSAMSFLKSTRAKQAKTASLLVAVLTLTGVADADEVSKTSSTTRPEAILPYTPGQPELLADRVFLPQEEFLKLYQLANPDAFDTPASPSESQVIAAFYKSADRRQVRDAKWSQAFTVRYVIRSYSRQSIDVALPIGKVAVTSAKLKDADAILVATPTSVVPAKVNTSEPGVQKPFTNRILQHVLPPKPSAASGYSVRIPSQGLHVLDVNFELPATMENSVGKLTLPLQPVAAGTILFELPEEQLEAKVNGRSNSFRTSGRTLTIPVTSAMTTVIEWKPRATQTVSDTIYHSSISSALMMNDTGLVLQSALTINCRQGQIAEVQLKIPPKYSVQTVEGPDIAGWTVNESDATDLTVLFTQPVDRKTSIQLTLFQRIVFGPEALKVDVPVPAVVGASRDSGTITILAGRELEVRVDSLSGVSQLNATDAKLPGDVDHALRKVLAWRYTRHPVAVSVRASRTAEKININSLHGVQLEQQRQLWTSLISASISGAPRRRLEIELPADYVALDVAANGMADWYYSESANNRSGTKILNIQFQSARQGKINAVIQGQTGRNQTELTAKIVVPKVPGANESATSVSVWLDASSEIASATANDWKRISRNTAIDPRILQLQSDAPDISFSSDSVSPVSFEIALRQAEASLGAESVTVTTVTDTSVELTLALKWKISGEATRTVSFTLPSELKDVFDFRIRGLRQLQKTDQGDTVKVTVHLQQPASDSLFVLGTGTLALPDSRQVASPSLQFVADDSGASRVSSQSHFWVIVNQSAGLLEAADSATDGEDVDAEEIKTNIPRQLLQQSVAIRRLRSDRPNSAWQLKFPERQKVAPAVVALAAHVTIVASDSTWRSHHALQVRNESRQFLPVILPPDSRILSCLVKQRPTRIVTRQEGGQLLHFIPIPQSGEISSPFDIQFSVAGQLPSIRQNIAGEDIPIPCPVIPEYRDFPEYGVTISRNTWQVYVPEEWQASMVNDPRQTNVIAASPEDLEDVRLMCSVDNMKSIISAAKSKANGNNDVRILQELQRQQLQLQDAVGNTAQTESERNEVLKKAESLFASQYGDPYEYDSSDGGRGQTLNLNPFSSGGSSSSSGTNIHLDQQEAFQNRFNSGNSLQILDANSGSGTVNNSVGLKFNFELPALLNLKTGRPQTPARGKKSKVAPPAKNNSKLLERRLSNQAQSFQNLNRSKSGSVRNTPNAQPSFGSRQLPFPSMQAPSAPPATRRQGMGRSEIPSFQGGQGGQGVAQSEGMESNQQRAAVNTQGLLSLQFSIPLAGVRHDFVRAGGNANLTLKVRSQKAVGVGIGIGWAVACLVLAITVLRGASKGTSSLLLRVLLLTSLVCLASLFCLPSSLSSAFSFVCVAAAVGACAVIVVRNFAKTNRPAM